MTSCGTDADGQLLSDGIYRLSISAKDADGIVVNTITTTGGVITGISYETGTAVLMVGDIAIPMGSVISIRIAEGG